MRPRLMRLLACTLAVAGALALATSVPAVDNPVPAKTPHRAGHKRTTKTAAKQTEDSAAAAERERREDLERRVEKLEQHYDMQQPTPPPPDAPARRSAP